MEENISQDLLRLAKENWWVNGVGIADLVLKQNLFCLWKSTVSGTIFLGRICNIRIHCTFSACR